MTEALKYTPGPWAWFGNASSNYVYLATVHGGRRYVMDFTRWGMRGAHPRFQPRERGGMIDAKDLLQFEVGDRSIVGLEDAKKDGSVYRYDIRGINCADAWLIAAAPELLEALKAEEQADRADERYEAMCASPDCDDNKAIDEVGAFALELRTKARELRKAAIAKAEGGPA
ncbi:hypothetical protein [Sinorhizobium meliloti]|uniref:hypothetical protein n=1 Tax=Rhizobium meliloti TaxID=382 RepID=UPI003704915F